MLCIGAPNDFGTVNLLADGNELPTLNATAITTGYAHIGGMGFINGDLGTNGDGDTLEINSKISNPLVFNGDMTITDGTAVNILTEVADDGESGFSNGTVDVIGIFSMDSASSLTFTVPSPAASTNFVNHTWAPDESISFLNVGTDSSGTDGWYYSEMTGTSQPWYAPPLVGRATAPEGPWSGFWESVDEAVIHAASEIEAFNYWSYRKVWLIYRSIP